MGDWSSVVGRGVYKMGKYDVTCHAFFPSGYMLLECNLTGFVSCSDILGILVRLSFVRLRVAARIRA